MLCLFIACNLRPPPGSLWAKPEMRRLSIKAPRPHLFKPSLFRKFLDRTFVCPRIARSFGVEKQQKGRPEFPSSYRLNQVKAGRETQILPFRGIEEVPRHLTEFPTVAVFPIS